MLTHIEGRCACGHPRCYFQGHDDIIENQAISVAGGKTYRLACAIRLLGRQMRALMFYADPKNWEAPVVAGYRTSATPAAVADGGELARKAMQPDGRGGWRRAGTQGDATGRRT
jgi:hypothetical protein